MAVPDVGLLKYCETERQKEVVQAFADGGSLRAAARSLGVTRQTAQDVVRLVRKRAVAAGYSPDAQMNTPFPEGISLKRISQRRRADGELLDYWQIGEPGKEQQEALLREFCAGLASSLAPSPSTPAPPVDTDQMLSAIVIGDGHLGMLAFGEETLGEDFNIEIATADLRAAIDYLVHCAPASSEGLLVNVGDFLHMDDTSNKTPASGHALDVDLSHHRLMRIAGVLLRYAIDKMLTKFATVRVVNAAGNHDPHSARALSMFLEGIYENHARVIVEPTKGKFYFLEFGNNLIGITHGDRIPANRLAGMMTQHAAEAWGRTKYRRWWVGHIHHKRFQEMEMGCSIESFNTLAAGDAWHASMGYSAERGIEMITLHKEFGQVGRTNASLALVRAFAGGELAA
ncbi:helix-turn-helix domain-containing protein [Kineobactrum salinum]|uniref:Helix-turn-helix domain-containing protein n=1 Tax=Kineobactrum salinum TaxID=2708301 RepID=A0A6C0U5S7_9GAMM|nr:helix-turn-helix domain-containing protein [Kineobactrum salinum]QIB67193.1 helix-turn-helix domain-containing protein [Kineobactrum salinum]